MKIIVSNDEYYPEPSLLGMSGSAHAVSGDRDEECEAVRLLRECVKEVTGKDVEPPPARKMGFLP